MIKIEVTGNSIGEVSDKLLAIGNSLREIPFVHEYKHQTVTLGAAEAEVAEAAPVDPTPSQPTSETSTPSPDTSTAEEQNSTPPASASDTLDFDTDVAPWVLRVVKEKGKPVAQEILAQFGVEKASLLDPAQWPELVEMLKGAL